MRHQLNSNDAFGQRYYANILTPFSRLVTPKITEILGFNLPVEMITTFHGVVWCENPTRIVAVKMFNVARSDKIDIITNVIRR